jgi:hypothetical protein
MTVPVTAYMNKFLCDGIETEFATTVSSINEDEIFVSIFEGNDEVEDLTLNVDYTVEVDTAGVTVTLMEAPADGLSLIVYRSSSYLQESNYTRQQGFNPVALNRDLDKIARRDQEIAGALDLRPHLPISFTGTTPKLPLPTVNQYLIGDGTNWIGTEIAPPAPAVSRIRVYETMETALADQEDIALTAAGGSQVIVKVKGGEQARDGGDCEFVVVEAEGTEDVRDAIGRRYGTEYRLFFGENDEAYTVWPDGVVNAVAFGMRAMEWAAGNNDDERNVDSRERNDGLFLRSNHFIGTGGGLIFYVPIGNFVMRDYAWNGDITAAGSQFLGAGMSRTGIHIGHWLDEFGESQWDDGTGLAPNPEIASRGPGRIRMTVPDDLGYPLKDLAIGNFSFYGEFMCERAIQITGAGLLHDMYVEKCNGRAFALSNPSGSTWNAFDPEAQDGEMRRLRGYQVLGTFASSYGQQNMLIDDIFVQTCWAEICCPDAARRATLRGIRGNDVCRRDDAAGTPIAGLYDGAEDAEGDNEAAGNGGVAAVVIGGAGAERVTISDFHITNVSQDVLGSDPAQGKYAFAIRPKENPTSGLITISSGTIRAARGILKVQTMRNEANTNTHIATDVTMSGVIGLEIAQDTNCGEARIDEGALRVSIVACSTDNDYFKIYGNHNFSAGNQNGTQVQDMSKVDISCGFSAITPKINRNWFVTELSDDLGNEATITEQLTEVWIENQMCFFRFTLKDIDPTAMVGVAGVRLLLPYRGGASIPNGAPFTFTVQQQLVTHTGTLVATVAPNGLQADLMIQASGANRTALLPAAFANNADLSGFFTYPLD